MPKLSAHRSWVRGAAVSRARTSTTISIELTRSTLAKTAGLIETRGLFRGKPTTLAIPAARFMKRSTKQGLVETTSSTRAVVQTIGKRIEVFFARFGIRHFELATHMATTSLECFGPVTSIEQVAQRFGNGFVFFDVEHAQAARDKQQKRRDKPKRQRPS